jgi:nuclear transport factor 2 (NTF2) superfamily protein
MNTTIKFPTPPWDMDTAAERLTFEEAAWNTHDPDQILKGYADDIEMRDGTEFINGKDELKQFLIKSLGCAERPDGSKV